MNNKGQGTVEYILLIAVVSTIAYSIMNSNAFKDVFDTASTDNFFNKLHKEVAFNYRYSMPLKRFDPDNTGVIKGNGDKSLNYRNIKEGSSRFFIPFEEVNW